MKRGNVYPAVIILAVLWSLVTGCVNSLPETEIPGVGKKLAESRAENISDVKYSVLFEIPSDINCNVEGMVSLSFKMKERRPIVLDFVQSDTSLIAVSANGKQARYTFRNEHIVIPASFSLRGENRLSIQFHAGNQSLNRREDLLYTLLVPDRARTLFPCFDQPDIKGRFSLSLEIPKEWEAVANGKVLQNDTIEPTERRFILFSETEPIPTYLFSFVAGKMNKVSEEKNGKKITIYHRESDPGKISQCDEIFSQIYTSLEWLENYTGVGYPFTKYDIVIIPGFQYGGMEHMGATLYSDRTMFLSENPTLNDRLSRAELIAHETAHMWFGDYVTMKWFDEVWTKEVFANWFAKRMVEPLFPEVNHRLNFLNSYFPAAYSEDRTAGATPVRQELDNLNNAGLVYGNIIYNKAPIVMDKLVALTGEENFQKGIREYLKRYGYSNATWDDLIGILDQYTEKDLKSWSHSWINKPGMAEIHASLSGDTVVTEVFSKSGKDDIGDQPLAYKVENGIPIPNTDGRGYGYFFLDRKSSGYILKSFSEYTGTKNGSDSSVINDDITRCSLMITLYENMKRGNLEPQSFCSTLVGYLPYEENSLILSRGLSYLADAYCSGIYNVKSVNSQLQEKLESTLMQIAEKSLKVQDRSLAFRALSNITNSSKGLDRLYSIWRNPGSFTPLKLGERELINLAYLLALHFPDRCDEIKKVQLERMTNTDRLAEFRYIFPSVSGLKEVRDSVFNSFKEEKNRSVEPWTIASLGYLNHYTRDSSSIDYIMSGLEMVEEVQRTGDIFFPVNWLKALLSGHHSREAASVTATFLERNKKYPPMLRNKILQQSDHLSESER
ncbi:MAG: M1 family aminopeptidase [Bacteroidales bacterium]|nr:M1 family aminopeptidase [Bacteroidales bacterium]